MVCTLSNGQACRELARHSHEFLVLQIALQESKSALGKGSLQKLDRDEKRKARMTTLHELFQVRNVADVFDL